MRQHQATATEERGRGASGHFEMQGDSIRGERACPMCRSAGALCGFHRQMFSERASVTGSGMMSACHDAAPILDRQERIAKYQRDARKPDSSDDT